MRPTTFSIYKRVIYISDMSQLHHSVQGGYHSFCLLPWRLTSHSPCFVREEKSCIHERTVYLKPNSVRRILCNAERFTWFFFICIFGTFFRTNSPKRGRSKKKKKKTFKSIFDMGHKYNVIGRTSTHTPVNAEIVAHLDACMLEYSYGFCISFFLSNFYFGTFFPPSIA